MRPRRGGPPGPDAQRLIIDGGTWSYRAKGVWTRQLNGYSLTVADRGRHRYYFSIGAGGARGPYERMEACAWAAMDAARKLPDLR